MVEVWCRYLGELEMEAVHGPSGTRMRTDAPVDNRGKGASFSPTDLVATALGTCIVSTIAIVARRRGIEVGEMRFRVEKHMATDPVRRIARLPVVVRLAAALRASLARGGRILLADGHRIDTRGFYEAATAAGLVWSMEDVRVEEEGFPATITLVTLRPA